MLRELMIFHRYSARYPPAHSCRYSERELMSVCHALQILERVAKNSYRWHGFAKLPQALQAMKVPSAKVHLASTLVMFSLQFKLDLSQTLHTILNSVCPLKFSISLSSRLLFAGHRSSQVWPKYCPRPCTGNRANHG